MSSLRPQDHTPLCRFTFADGLPMPDSPLPNHARFCSGHARKDSRRAANNTRPRPLLFFLRGIPFRLRSQHRPWLRRHQTSLRRHPPPPQLRLPRRKRHHNPQPLWNQHL